MLYACGCRGSALLRGWQVVDTLQAIRVAVADGIATITLHRPQKRNAVSLAMWRRLADVFAELAARADVHLLILTGAGGNFCAGADISEFSRVRADAQSGRAYEAVNEAAILALRDCCKPTIAAVSGYGVGGGCALALACDLRVGDASTRMGIPAARLGIVYGEVDCALLYRRVGLANAKRILFSGRHFDATECAAIGLIDILAPGTALEGAHALAGEFADSAPLSLSGCKLVLESLASGTATARRSELNAAIERAMVSADYREGTRAFLEKRKAAFKGK